MGSARGNWDPREGQQPFRPNPNGAGDRTTTLRRLLIGAVFRSSSLTAHSESDLALSIEDVLVKDISKFPVVLLGTCVHVLRLFGE